MPSIGEILKEAYQYGKDREVDATDLRLLIMKTEGLQEQIDVIINKDLEVKHPEQFWEMVHKLVDDDMPVEYIINEANFLGFPLYVDNNVLIPRGETEEMVAKLTEEIGKYYDPRNFLVCGDIGTGSGCIPIALKKYFPNWVMEASDISEGALKVARKNFDTYHMDVETFLGDALDPYIENKVNLDIIISNPPYIKNKEDAQDSVRKYEPASALWLDEDNSVYESIFRDCYKVKKGDLLMIFEISPDLEPWLTSLMNKYLDNPEYRFLKDLNGFTRFLFVYLE